MTRQQSRPVPPTQGLTEAAVAELSATAVEGERRRLAAERDAALAPARGCLLGTLIVAVTGFIFVFAMTATLNGVTR